MNITTIIVTYNGGLWINKCLHCLEKSSLKSNIIIIDNGSTDGTPLIIEQNFPKVHLIKSKKNLGFGQGNNLGIKKALERNFDYIFLLNQDAWIKNDTLEHLVKVSQNNPNYGILSPVHLNGKGTKLDYLFSTYIEPDSCPNYISDIILSKPLKSVYPIAFINAAAWLIPKKAIINIGGFDPIFFHYGEDNNYIQRMTFHGFKTGIVPSAFVFHDREDREDSLIQSNPEYNYKRNLLSKLADINLVDISLPNKMVKGLFKRWLIASIGFNFKKAKTLWKKRKLLRSLIPAITKSRNINKKKGPHYLR